MIRETYKGRKILVTKGKHWGYAEVKVNGVSVSTHLGTQESALPNIRANIDYIGDEIDGARWGAEWYTKGTFELCANDHPHAIGGICTHPYCIDEMCSDCGTPKKDHCAICSLCQWFCNDKEEEEEEDTMDNTIAGLAKELDTTETEILNMVDMVTTVGGVEAVMAPEDARQVTLTQKAADVVRRQLGATVVNYSRESRNRAGTADTIQILAHGLEVKEMATVDGVTSYSADCLWDGQVEGFLRDRDTYLVQEQGYTKT